MKRTLSGMLLLLLACGSANAALLSRAGGQAYYDDVLDITWMADANLAYTSGYMDAGSSNYYGNLSQAGANGWIDSLNAASYLGASNWRLPTMIDTGAPGCDHAYSGTDCGFNVDLSSEMAHLFYSTLGNVAAYTTTGSPTGCGTYFWSTSYGYQPNPSCLTNTGPFSNLLGNAYWSGPDAGYATSWAFNFFSGKQSYVVGTDSRHLNYEETAWENDYEMKVWAVSSGDIALAPVPVPGAVWMLGSALGVLGMVRRKGLTGAG